MTRTETRRQALRAAFAVSLTMGLMGCGGGVVVEDGDKETTPDETPNPPNQEEPTEVADAGPPTTDAEPSDSPMDASIADASDAANPDGGPLCVLGDDWEAYAACCEAVNWDYNAGCMAWGPPVPPAMGVA